MIFYRKGVRVLVNSKAEYTSLVRLHFESIDRTKVPMPEFRDEPKLTAREKRYFAKPHAYNRQRGKWGKFHRKLQTYMKAA